MTAPDEQRRLGTLEGHRESDERRLDELENFRAGTDARREAESRQLEELKRQVTDLEQAVKVERKETRDKLEEVRVKLPKRPKLDAPTPPRPPGKGGSILSGAGAGRLVSVVAEVIRGGLTDSDGH